MMNIQAFTDKFAITVSTICALHCVAVPALLVLAPSLTLIGLGDEVFHQWLLIIIVPSSLFALSLGCKKHKRLPILLWGLLGLSIVIFAGLYGHDTVGETGEKVLTVIGSLVIIYGHLRNHAACKEHEHKCEVAQN